MNQKKLGIIDDYIKSLIEQSSLQDLVKIECCGRMPPATTVSKNNRILKHIKELEDNFPYLKTIKELVVD